MNSRQRIADIFNHRESDRCGFWLGNPRKDTRKLFAARLGLDFDLEHGGKETLLALDIALAKKTGSDAVWFSAEHDYRSWKGQPDRQIFDLRVADSADQNGWQGVLNNCETVSDLDKFSWPDPALWDFEPTVGSLKKIHENDLAVFSGMWMPFFHILSDLFGMEQYFINMYTNPLLVEAATQKVLDFYLEANRKFLERCSDYVDVFFFGNDLGCQQDLLISPESFRKFILPGYKAIVGQVKSYGLKVMLHSCGSISKVIPDLIDIGIDGLNPLQSRAAGMSPEVLAREFGESLVFIGGVDTQQLLPCGTPLEIMEEVYRLNSILGPHYIVSPSHDALLPNVPWENVEAMAKAALDLEGRTTECEF